MDASRVIVSPNARRVGMRPKFNLLRNVMSVESTNDFCVRVTTPPLKSTPFPGGVFIGFTTRDAFTRDTDITCNGGVYTIQPFYGRLHGYRKLNTVYCQGHFKAGGTVRCVADRARATISFHLDGVDRGVAWTNVGMEPLHALVSLYAGVEVELL